MKTLGTLYHRVGLGAGLLLAVGSALAGPEHESTLTKAFLVTAGGRLVLQANQGSCQINPIETDKVEIRVLRKVKGGTKAEADELFTNHQVTFQQESSTVSVTAINKKNLSLNWRPNRPSLEVRYEISLPAKFDVDLKTSGGDIRIGELAGKVSAHTSGGAIDLKYATGSVAAFDSGGDILIGGTDGEILARTSSGAIKVQKVQGKADISNSGGDILIGDAGQMVVARTSSGAIRLKSVKGNVEASNSGGDIQAETVGGEMTASTSSGSISIGQLKGESARLSNSGGAISLGSAEGSVVAKTSSGAIKLNNVGGSVDASNSGGDILVGQAGGDLSAETSSGAIKIRTAKGAVSAKNSGGDIRIEEAGAQVNARTSSGSIAIKVARGRAELRDSGGDIKIEQAHAAVQANTSSGTIAVGFVAPPTEPCRLEVSGGGISVVLPKSAAVDLDAKTSGGKAESELPVTTTVQGQSRSGVLQGKINGGGPLLFLRASSGNIRLRTLPDR